jgi:hypothetical protein
MKLTKQKLYQLIQEAIVPDPDPTYASLYNPNQPMALLHMDDEELQTFILYHLTKSKQHPVFVVAYLNMEMIESKPCIPYTYQVLGVYTEAAAQQKGFSRTMYNFAFYVADRFDYGLTSDHLVGTTQVAQKAAWSKFENSSEYEKRTTAQGNSKFDYDGKLTPNDPDDDCENTFGEKDPATDFSFQKENHGQIGQLYFKLKSNHQSIVDVNNIEEKALTSKLYQIASRRFDYYYNKEITR